MDRLKTKHNLLCDNMKNKIVILLLILANSLFAGIQAQEIVATLEAEKAELTLPAKVKYVTGYSGNAYVGDNDSGSAILFKNVNIGKEGTYEFRTYYTSMHIRSIAIKSGNYPKIISTTPTGTPDWNTPPVAVMTTYIYLNQGINTIAITPYNGGGPNIDKFEILTTSISMPRPEPVKITFDYDLTDDNVMIESNNTSDNLAYLIDNDEYTMYSPTGSSAEIKITCDMPYLLTGYLLSTGPNDSKTPKNWKLEYSTDGNTYSTIAPSKVEDLENGTMFHVTRAPHQETNKAAQYYKLTTRGGTIGEIQLFGIPYLANTDKKNFPADITQGVDIRSKVMGIPLGVYMYGSFDERCYNLFDQDMSKKYYSSETSNVTVEIELSNPAALDYYTLTSCQDYPERDPKSWVVEGFDRDWEPVSEVHGFVFPTRYAAMKFYSETDKKYRGYRLRTLENNGANSFQLLKWQLFEKVAGAMNQVNYPELTTIYTSGQEIIIKPEKAGKYWITNLSGQLISSGLLNTTEQSLNMERGIYIVKIIADKEVLVKKVAIK